MKLSPLAAAVAAATVHIVQPATARDQMWVVSDSTTLPFTKVVAAHAASMAHGPGPFVEHAATGLAFTFLCGGTGAEHPDAASVTRRMRKREFDVCQKNGVTE